MTREPVRNFSSWSRRRLRVSGCVFGAGRPSAWTSAVLPTGYQVGDRTPNFGAVHPKIAVHRADPWCVVVLAVTASRS